MQFVAGDALGKAVFNQAVACQARFAFKSSGDDVGEEMVAVALHFDVLNGDAVRLSLLACTASYTAMDRVCVCPGMLPAIISVAPNSPKARAKASSKPLRYANATKPSG